MNALLLLLVFALTFVDAACPSNQVSYTSAAAQAAKKLQVLDLFLLNDLRIVSVLFVSYIAQQQ